MKGCWDMISKKLVSKVVLGLMLATPFSYVEARAPIYNEFSTEENINIDSSESDVKLTIGGNETANFAVFAPKSKSVNLTGNENIFTVNAEIGNVAIGIEAQADSNVVIGNENSNNIMNISSDQWIFGIRAAGVDKDTQGASVTINGKSFVLNAECTSADSDGSVYGLYAQNFTTDADENNRAKLVVNAENTIINVKSASEGAASGLVAMSQGILEVNSNIEVNADNVIVARGDAIVKVNESGEKTTKLNGDINFNYDGPTSGTKVNADVTVNLSGENSYWNGNSKISWNYDKKNGSMPSSDKLDVDNLKLNISDGAQWNPVKVENVNIEGEQYISGEQYIALNNLTLNDGVINLENMQDQELQIENVSSTNGIVNVASSDNKLAITKKNDINSLTVAANQDYSEQLVQNDMGVSLQNLIDQVVDSTDKDNVKSAATSAYLSETAVTGVTTAQVDEKGKVILNTIVERVNPSNNAISNMASIALMAWRAENNDMNKRLGELRDSKGEHGIWARMVRGEGTYESIKNQYNTYQLGYDEKLSTNPNWTVGAAVSYTEGESGFNGGSGENKHTGFSVYGSYLNDDGSFIDLIAKYARLDHDFDVIGGAGSGDYETNGYSVSAEYGKRFKQDNGMWIEPQVELTYGKIGSANYKTDNGVSVRQDGMDSLVGRIGFALGKDFKQGNAYVRASYLYDFEGETDISFTKGNVTRGFEQDLGGGWFEVGVGTNINLSDATHLYMDIEKTYGGDVATPWQWNVGVRYSF